MDEDYKQLEVFAEALRFEYGLSKNTVESYVRDLQLFLSYLRHTKKKNGTQASEEEIRDYFHFLYKAGYNSNTIARRLSGLRKFFAFLRSEKMRADNPTLAIENPNRLPPLPRILGEEQIKIVINELATRAKAAAIAPPESKVGRAKDNPLMLLRNLLIIELLYGSGMRVTELAYLQLGDVNYECRREKKKIKPYMIIRGKGSKERVVPLSDSTITILEEYLPALREWQKRYRRRISDWLLPSNIDHEVGVSLNPITRQRIHQIIVQATRGTEVNLNNVSAHVMRHCFATHLLDHGVNLKVIQDFLGHASIATTQIYTHTTSRKLINTVQHHHPLANNKSHI